MVTILTMGGRTGRKIHSSGSGSSSLGCGRWVKHSVRHFTFDGATAPASMFCEKCFSASYLAAFAIPAESKGMLPPATLDAAPIEPEPVREPMVVRLTSYPMVHTPGMVRFLLAGGHRGLGGSKKERKDTRAWQVEALGALGICYGLALRIIDRTVAIPLDPEDASVCVVTVPEAVRVEQEAYTVRYLESLKPKAASLAYDETPHASDCAKRFHSAAECTCHKSSMAD